MHENQTRSASLAQLVTILLAVTLLGSPNLLHDPHCQSESLRAPSTSQALIPTHSVSEDDSNSPRLAKAGVTPWRQIDTVIVLPEDFSNHPVSGQSLGKTPAELENEARTLIAMANHYLRPLKLVIRVVEIRNYFGNSSDPFKGAVSRRNAFEMLQTGISLHGSHQATDYDLVLVLARRHFQGSYGLAYPAVSCVSQQYSVVFATQGGDGAAMEYSLSHTIAHEIGHYLGMTHDSETYLDGSTLMAPLFSVHPTGYSENSKLQANSHSAPGQPGGSCFADIVYGIPGDTDGDGVSDLTEEEDGSEPTDAGSYQTHLKSPVNIPWNGFLDMVNIAELVNSSATPLTITATLFDQFGLQVNSQQLVVPAHGQFDLILNQLPGFAKNSYGLLKLTFQGSLDGRMSFYRMSSTTATYEFGYSIPFINPSYDTTLVAFNTHQPSTYSPDLNNQVANWLTLVNLASEPKLFRVNSLNQVGGVLKTTSIALPAYGRADLDGGHGFAGGSVVGVHKIIPEDPHSPYLAQLNRYGSNASSQYAPSGYHFAFPLVAHAGTSQTITLPMSTRAGEDNWLEIGNTLAKTAELSIEFMGANGVSLGHQTLSLGAYQQWHIDAATLLKTNNESSGIAIITPSSSSSILAQSMNYFREATGRVSAIYGESMNEPLASELFGSYNLFLGMENVLTLSNSSSVEVRSQIVADGNKSITVELPPNSTKHLALSRNELLNLNQDSYGFLRITNSIPNAVSGSLVRMRSSNGITDLAMPTALR